MKRTFNFTGRKNINREDVPVTIDRTPLGLAFNANPKLDGYGFPEDAEIWIEAYRGNLIKQCSWGKVSQPEAPLDRGLSDFEVPDGIQFRLRVVSLADGNLLKMLGEADHVVPTDADENPDNRRPLITPVPHDLGQQLWKIDFVSDPPSLLVNNQAKDGWRDIARSSAFIALVYPQVMRSMLFKILIEDEWDEDGADWQNNWVQFAKQTYTASVLPAVSDHEGREKWIDDAVDAFASSKNLKDLWDANS
jgi:hypothetical protein